MEKWSKTSHWKVKVGFICKKPYLILESCFVYVVEAFIIVNLKARHKDMSSFSSMLLVHIYLFFFVNFSYKGLTFMVIHA